jgi:hypothetical protein
MQELFALKGDNIPRDALTSIQFQPTIGEATRWRRWPRPIA